MELHNLIDEKQLAELENKLKDSKNKVEKIVREYPLTSVVIAFGIGYILAKMLEKSRR